MGGGGDDDNDDDDGGVGLELVEGVAQIRRGGGDSFARTIAFFGTDRNAFSYQNSVCESIH